MYCVSSLIADGDQIADSHENGIFELEQRLLSCPADVAASDRGGSARDATFEEAAGKWPKRMSQAARRGLGCSSASMWPGGGGQPDTLSTSIPDSDS